MTEEQKEKLLRAVRAGTDLETSCHFAGLSIAEVYRDLEKGKSTAARFHAEEKLSKDEERFFQFWQELTAARADAIVRNVASVQQAAQNGSWQAAAWWLERSVPETYSKTHTDRPRQSIDNPRGQISEK